MVHENTVIDHGYVIDVLNDESYFTANVGLYKTRKQAEKQCERLSRAYKDVYELKVRRVALVVDEEDVHEGNN